MMSMSPLRSKGAVMLAALGDRQVELAAKLGVKSRPLISMWRSGERKPKLANRKQLLAKLKIPIEAWDEPPDAPSSWGEAAASGQVEMLEQLGASIRSQVINDASLTPLERVRMVRELAKLAEDVRRLKGEDVVEVDVLRHPKWVELKSALLAALERHPEALRAVVEALETLESREVHA